LSLSTDDVILYLKDLENSTKKLLDIIHLQQSSRIQNQYTKNRSFSIYQQQMARSQWLAPVILPTQEVEIKRIAV
jgi:hypothetical protein